MSKLELENNLDEKTLYARLIKTSIDNLIQKLPTHICIWIINYEITDLRSLINILQEKNLYEEPCLNSNQNKVRQDKNFKPFLQPNHSYVPCRPYFQQPCQSLTPNYTNDNTFPPNHYSPRPIQPTPNLARPFLRQNQCYVNRFR